MSKAARVFLGLCWTMTVCFGVTASLLLFPWLETRYWPVVSKLHFDQVEADGPDRSKVYASFSKKRSCNFIGIAWYRGKKEVGFTRVPLTLARDPGDVSSPNRPVGYQKTGPWIVGIPADEIVGNSFVELFHQCVPFWVTTTEFYP